LRLVSPFKGLMSCHVTQNQFVRYFEAKLETCSILNLLQNS
jgi:hypothetical protein